MDAHRSSALGLSLLLAANALAQDVETWRTRQVGVGVTWQRVQQVRDGSPQSFEVLTIAAEAQGSGVLRLLEPKQGQREETSVLGARGGAIAAINGGFFDVKTGEPDGLRVVDGALRSAANERRAEALVVDRAGSSGFRPAASVEVSRVDLALAAGPLLLRGGEVVESRRREDPRHPRTAIGRRADGTLLLLCADGRTEHAAGLSFAELTALMRELGCTDALNLDGGGSTTLWLAAQGVVNHPCDNKLFDHRGERAVSDALGVFAPLVVELDEDDAMLVPGGAWTSVADGEALDGDRARTDCEGARAVFQVGVPRNGRYRITVDLRGSAEAPNVAIDGRACAPKASGPKDGWDLGSVQVDDAPRTIEVVLVARGPLALDALRAVESR
ncbi:MAG: phosphodiester glycosidase family protein [Planctomycetota bacterium]